MNTSRIYIFRIKAISLSSSPISLTSPSVWSHFHRCDFELGHQFYSMNILVSFYTTHLTRNFTIKRYLFQNFTCYKAIFTRLFTWPNLFPPIFRIYELFVYWFALDMQTPFCHCWNYEMMHSSKVLRIVLP